MIDEFPILFVAAAHGEWDDQPPSGLHELRVKESDRLTQMAAGLKSIGANVTEQEDGLVIEGSGGEYLERRE